ncbi:adenosine deaminase [Paenibacillus sp. FSL H8-0548]|uniref:adenosine deaminase n=1 Tax=Paenibacillus sp. FSL H8-0548 TaxID=1920422 RepID=UPI00096D3626|nr:adenosine deaminase [Paenibacillus sp. FSL H8-0548]OMF24858.1 adenosine deaminase [Paenibacillus sp. FSL H8-0548]
MTLVKEQSAAVIALLSQLPKVDLHVHLDGSVKPDTLVELAREQGNPLQMESNTELLSHMQVEEHCESLKEYLEKFSFVLPYLQTGAAIERVAYELVEQAANENVRYIEVRFAPQLHRIQGLTNNEVIAHVLAGLQRGEQTFGTIARAIIICLRSHSYEINTEVIKEAARFLEKGVVAVDLAGDEASFPAKLFRQLFEEAKQLGLPITIHAGEAAGAASVKVAITELGAVRIGHGVRMLEDSEVVGLVKEQQIPLEMCPLSNIQTKAVSSWANYPIRGYMEQGIVVTVNTDNRTVSHTTIQKEYELLIAHCGLTLDDIGTVIMNGIKAAFLEDNVKQLLIEQFEQELAASGVLV